MKHKRIIVLSIIMVLSILVVLYLIFLPSYLCFDMPCMEMTAEGEELEEGQLVLTGLQYREFAHGMEFTRLIPFKLQIPDYQGYEPEYPSHPNVATSVYPGCLTTFFYARDNGGVTDATACFLVWHTDRSCCVAYVDGRFFVGSRSGDYEAALELFHSVLYIPD